MTGFKEMKLTGTIRFAKANSFMLLCKREDITEEVKAEFQRVWSMAFGSKKPKPHQWVLLDGNLENWDNFEGSLYLHLETHRQTWTKDAEIWEWDSLDHNKLDNRSATVTFKAYPRERYNQSKVFVEAEEVDFLEEVDPDTIPFKETPPEQFEEMLSEEDLP